MSSVRSLGGSYTAMTTEITRDPFSPGVVYIEEIHLREYDQRFKGCIRIQGPRHIHAVRRDRFDSGLILKLQQPDIYDCG